MAFADSGGGGGGSVGSSLGSLAAKAAKTVTKSNPIKPKTSGGSSKRSSGNRSSGSRSGGGSSSGGSRYSGGNSGGGGSSAPPKATKPVIPSINAYLGTDSVYQDYLRGSKRTLADYLSEITRRRNEAGTQFNDTKASMERDRVQQLDDLKNEYASRGLINSSLYGEEQGKFQQNYMTQLDALQKQQTGLLADLIAQQTNFTREQELSNERARQEALARRVAKYNIGG